MKVQPLIAVSDVQRSSRWYQKILKCKSGHGGSDYEQLIKEDDEDFFLQLHPWNADDHPNLGDPNAAPHGYGVLLWFLVDNFADAVKRARSIKAEIIEEPHVNSQQIIGNVGCVIPMVTS